VDLLDLHGVAAAGVVDKGNFILCIFRLSCPCVLAWNHPDDDVLPHLKHRTFTPDSGVIGMLRLVQSMCWPHTSGVPTGVRKSGGCPPAAVCMAL
jgi:hypothetical protein